MKTIRDLIQDIQKEVRATSLTPGRASELLNQLSSLSGNVSEELKNREMDYNRKLLEVMNTVDKVALAKLIAQTSPEYETLIEAKNTQALVQEMIRSMKYTIRVALEEYRENKTYQ